MEDEVGDRFLVLNPGLLEVLGDGVCSPSHCGYAAAIRVVGSSVQDDGGCLFGQFPDERGHVLLFPVVHQSVIQHDAGGLVEGEVREDPLFPDGVEELSFRGHLRYCEHRSGRSVTLRV